MHQDAKRRPTVGGRIAAWGETPYRFRESGLERFAAWTTREGKALRSLVNHRKGLSVRRQGSANCKFDDTELNPNGHGTPTTAASPGLATGL